MHTDLRTPAQDVPRAACPGVDGLEDRGTLRFAPATHAEGSLLECTRTFLTRGPIIGIERSPEIGPIRPLRSGPFTVRHRPLPCQRRRRRPQLKSWAAGWTPAAALHSPCCIPGRTRMKGVSGASDGLEEQETARAATGDGGGRPPAGSPTPACQ